jgi:hypothetical protein
MNCRNCIYNYCFKENFGQVCENYKSTVRAEEEKIDKKLGGKKECLNFLKD